jgi:hypothetical protein
MVRQNRIEACGGRKLFISWQLGSKKKKEKKQKEARVPTALSGTCLQ